MTYQISILGSTGSIGKTLIKILLKEKKNFKVSLLTADKNYKTILNQARKLNTKNIIISDKKSYQKALKFNKAKKIKIYNNYDNLKKIFINKNDYIMSSISGINGLYPTLKVIKYTKSIAIANKESIICGWNLIKRKLKINNTKFIPVDSEHFSIWYAIKNNRNKIKKIFLTASGGPFINLPLNEFKKIKIKQALKHPNWKMGKKISIDSATMVNKVFEIIEAKKIFDLNYNQLSILTHPKSYIHAIVQFNNGLIKLIAHETNMKIPILNTINFSLGYETNIKSSLEISKLNFLELNKINIKKFPIVNILKILPDKNSLFETIFVAANDELVNQFLNKKINFLDINIKLKKILKMREFNKYKNIQPKNIDEIVKLSNYVRLKINSKSI